MFGRQRRPEILIAGLQPCQHRHSELCRVGPVRHPTAVPMLQSFRSSRPIPRPDPSRLPITELQQLGGFAQSQVARLPPPHHFHPTQLFPAQSCSPQSRFLLAEGTLKGDTSNVVSWGTFLMWFNTVSLVFMGRHTGRSHGHEGTEHSPEIAKS